MKRIIICILLLSGVFIFNSCDDGIEEEQFVKSVLLTKNGLQDYDIEYSDEGKVDLTVVVSVNGTSNNQENATATLILDPDTLDVYNVERYRDRESLYYQLVTESMYEFVGGNTTSIKAGENKAIMPLTIHLDKFDLYKQYILPLRIGSSTVYPIRPGEHSIVLMRLNVSNFFSGSYTISGNMWEQNASGDKLPLSSGSLYAIGADKCYLYAGNVTENNTNRDEYTLTAQVDKNVYEDTVDDTTDADIRTYTSVTIGSRNSDKEVKDESGGKNWIKVTKTPNPVDKNLETVLTQMYVKYSFLNKTDVAEPIRMVVEATYSHSVSVEIEK